MKYNYNSANNESKFVSHEDAYHYLCDVLHTIIDSSVFASVIKYGLIPQYVYNSSVYYIKDDLISISNLFVNINTELRNKSDFVNLLLQEDRSCINIGNNTILDFVYDESGKDPVLFSSIRNIISHCNIYDCFNSTEMSIPYFSGSILTSSSAEIIKFAEQQMERNKRVDVTTTSLFTRSAHYMGSKSLLCGFIVEALSSVLPDSGRVLDLMCGSGVVSGAFNKIWKTYSSDALDFCKLLSIVHGGGFDKQSAQQIISTILPIAKQNFEKLHSYLRDAIDFEDNLFCRDIDSTLVHDYSKFTNNFPILSKPGSGFVWDPKVEVKRRIENPMIYPYCLFTAYFANVYFGLRQCVEIDSLRYAIDQVQDKRQKQWALGVLVATISTLGTTFGGHFAQPPSLDLENISNKKLSSIITTRSFSITHEFTVRLLNLSDKSEESKNDINIIQGPWQDALATFGHSFQPNLTTLVYLDAPYTREEYSRYYHVLETLVSYSYPSCTGKGLTPKPGERFRSEFFTRTESKIKQTITDIVVNILRRGWICAWSYSNTAAANMYEVIEFVSSATRCNVKSYCVPFVHKSQGGARPKNVLEYLIIFTPQ